MFTIKNSDLVLFSVRLFYVFLELCRQIAATQHLHDQGPTFFNRSMMSFISFKPASLTISDV